MTSTLKAAAFQMVLNRTHCIQWIDFQTKLLPNFWAQKGEGESSANFESLKDTRLAKQREFPKSNCTHNLITLEMDSKYCFSKHSVFNSAAIIFS